jgi:hypothetical protein
LRIPPQRSFDPVREALAAIDSVHGAGDLPLLPVRMGRGRREFGGYEYARDGRALALVVSRHSEHPHLTVVHEIGHFLDHQAFGIVGRFASESRRVVAVMDAITQSSAVQVLRSREAMKQVLVQMPHGGRRIHRLSQRYVGYLLEPKECFARAYAQLIAVRSRDPRLLDELSRLQGDLLAGGVYHQQWSDDDFAPIAAALDQSLRRMGWAW